MWRECLSRPGCEWPIDNEVFSSLRQGLKRTYAKGRTKMARVQTTPSTGDLHEWRKRVKDLGYQVRLLAPAWPGGLKDLADELERLAGYLSDEHDLAILRRSMRQWGSKDLAQSEALVGLIDERRCELEMEAKRWGERLYVEKPNAFVRRFKCYWRAGGAESKVEPSIAANS